MIGLTSKEVALLLDQSERSVQLAAQQNRYYHWYELGRGRGGRSLRISLESLPESAQARYRGEETERQQSAYNSLTAEQRAVVDHKVATVLRYKDFKRMYRKSDKMVAFLEDYHVAHPDRTLTRRQLNHWEKKYDREGLNGLIDRRGGYNRGLTSIPDDMWEVFLKLWSKTSKPSARSCYKMLAPYFPHREIPHMSSFIRKLELAVDYPYEVLHREGKKAYEDKCTPYNMLDYSTMYSNQQWVSDHHIFDVLLVDESGKVFRAWVCAWFDRKSRCIVGYSISDRDPNSDLILDSFAKSCHAAGIPDSVLLDNGKDFKVYDIFNSDFALSVSNEMGIVVHRALPYNAKAKPLERFFGTLEGYCKHLSAYIGNSPGNRPEDMQGTNAKLKDKAMPVAEFRQFVDNAMTVYNNEPHSGEGMNGRTPIDVYTGSFTKPMRVVRDEDVLNMFLMRTSKPLIVGRNGVKVPQIGFWFDDDRLYPLQKQKVFVRYNTEDVKKVYVYSEKDEFICIAKSRDLCTLDMDVSMETIRENNKRKALRRKITKSMLPTVDAPTIEESVAARASSGKVLNYRDIVEQVPIVNSTKHKHAKSIQAEEQRQLDEEQDADVLVSNGRNVRDIDAALYNRIKEKGGSSHASNSG